MNALCYTVAVILAVVLWFLCELHEMEAVGKEHDDERDLP